MDTVLQDKFPVKRLAAFSEGDFGGNPAGVVICEALPDASVMQAIAAQVHATQQPRPRGQLFASGDSSLSERTDEALAGFGDR